MTIQSLKNNMRAIEDIYVEYQVMPNMREHMYRVAAVAKIICDNFKGE